MSIINKFFGSSPSEKTSTIPWQILDSSDELENLIRNSDQSPAIIFKHSTRCSISRMALKQFESEFALHDKVTPYFLDLLKFREVSNLVASRLNVVHQSPQLIVIKDRIAVYDASHSDISADVLAKKI
ncbi:MAG: bacillithiol system redox-active protein YtxJ [Flavobacterium sp.]|nr:bacillithiol system redox-active protein YtxJ [Flavobacterium sp.]